jgi:hypothetical protein
MLLHPLAVMPAFLWTPMRLTHRHHERGGVMMVLLASAMGTTDLCLSHAETVRQDEVCAITCNGGFDALLNGESDVPKRSALVRAAERSAALRSCCCNT